MREAYAKMFFGGNERDVAISLQFGARRKDQAGLRALKDEAQRVDERQPPEFLVALTGIEPVFRP
jgi:hypothetical protein